MEKESGETPTIGQYYVLKARYMRPKEMDGKTDPFPNRSWRGPSDRSCLHHRRIGKSSIKGKREP